MGPVCAVVVGEEPDGVISKLALETLAIVGIGSRSTSEIEEVRGVSVDAVLES